MSRRKGENEAQDGGTQRKKRVTANAGGSTSLPEAPVEKLTDYERARLEQIQRNRERMAALNLPALAMEVALEARAVRGAAHPPSSKAKRAGKAPSVPEELRRRSARVRGVAPDGVSSQGVAAERRDGSILLNAGTSVGLGEQRPARPVGPVPLQTTDTAFLELLRGQDDGRRPDASCPEWPTHASGSGPALGHLKLQEQDVAKLTKQGVSVVAFHPSASRLLLAACDKSGQVCLWDVDHAACASGANGSGANSADTPQLDNGGSAGPSTQVGAAEEPGIVCSAPHGDYVSAMRWAGAQGGTAPFLVTASYDGSIRRLDPVQCVWEVLGGAAVESAGSALAEGLEELSAMEVSADGRAMWVATPDGDLAVLDPRVRDPVQGPLLEVSERKVNTLSLEPSHERLLAASCSDGRVVVFDVRQLAARGATTPAASGHKGSPAAKNKSRGCEASRAVHTKSCQSATWAPDGSGRLLTVSFDDTVRVWGPGDGVAGVGAQWVSQAQGALGQQLQVKHNNNTGRWVMPFRPAWAAPADAFLVGNMTRGVDVFTIGAGAKSATLTAVLRSEYMTAIPSRVAVHPAGLPVLAAATSSGRVHVYR